MARAFNFSPNEYLEPLQNVPGAAGTAQQPQVIIPPGYGQYQSPWEAGFNTFAQGLMQNIANERTQKQYGEAVKGLGEFWPILNATGVTEGQVNEMLKSGMNPQDIVHYALTQQASRSMKGLDWAHEAATHERDVQEKSYTADQMDVVQSYADGKLSLSDAMRQSGLTSTQLKAATEQLSSGFALQEKPIEQQKKKLDLQKEKTEVENLPSKLAQEGAERLARINKLEQDYNMAPTKEAREAAKLKLDQDKFEFAKWKDGHKTTKGLTPENQKLSNQLKGLGTAQAMYNQAKQQGLDVRLPIPDQYDKAKLLEKKGETKESYYKNVILPALQNRQLLQTYTQSSTYNFPNTPYGKMAPSIAQNLGIDPNIFGRQVQQESGWNPKAVSKVGAFGMMQFMPGTAKQFGYTDEQLRQDPMLQLGLGASLMKKLLNRFNGDYALALASYNAGTSMNAKEAQYALEHYPETQAYVRAILGTGSMTPASTGKKSLDEVL